MVAVSGTYNNGEIKLDKEVASEKPLRVVVTFLDDFETPGQQFIKTSKFNFKKSQELLSSLKSSLSDELIKERRDSK
ncbi:MAG: hypothetical protein U0V04_07290 [Spirosomataceae bacterium]|jgi:hypothetical protein